MTQPILTYALFKDSGTTEGKAGLTVTVDVLRVKKSDDTGSWILTGETPVDRTGGIYSYRVANGDLDLYDYIVIFKTAAGDIIEKHLGAIRWDGAERITMAAIAAAVWANATRTLSSFGTLAADVWTYAIRTLTQTPTSIVSAVTGDKITDIRGSTWAIPLTLDYDITGLKVQIALKGHKGDTDEQAIQFIDSVSGLITVNGATAEAAQNVKGSITIVDASVGSIIWKADPDITASHRSGNFYGIQVVDASSGDVLENWGGSFVLTEDIVRASE